MDMMKGENQRKAMLVLQLLEGMSIRDAQTLLSWCSDFLLGQPVYQYGYADANGYHTVKECVTEVADASHLVECGTRLEKEQT